MVGSVEGLKNIADDDFGSGEGEVGLKLVGFDGGAELMKGLAFLRRAHAAGAEIGAAEFEPDDGAAHARAVEHVEVQIARELITHGDATNAVAAGIEWRGENAEAEL